MIKAVSQVNSTINFKNNNKKQSNEQFTGINQIPNLKIEENKQQALQQKNPLKGILNFVNETYSSKNTSEFVENYTMLNFLA